jgi:T5SS/PEP-CTERM-associated repeat protein
MVMVNGARVNSTFTWIGDQANSSGAITVKGLGAELKNDAELVVGNLGLGSLDVASDGLVTAANVSNAGTVTIRNGGVLDSKGRYTQAGGFTNLLNGSQVNATALDIDLGLFQGSGTVQGPTTIFSRASIAPGADSSSAGTMTFTTGPLQVYGTFTEFLTPTGFGLAAVQGSATLDSGSSVLDIRQDPSYIPPVGTTLVIITADAPVQGRFKTFRGVSFAGKTEYWTVQYNQGGNNVVLVASPGCGDDRTDLIGEYANVRAMDVWRGGSFVPNCGDFTDNASGLVQPPVSFADLIQGDDYTVANGHNHNWALVRGPLYIDGSYGAKKLYDDLFVQFDVRPVVTSGYRNPVHNLAVSKKAGRTSRHMFGDAIDFDNPLKTEEHCEEMAAVTLLESFLPVLEPCPSTQAEGYHLHAEWRVAGPYAK